MQCSRASSGGRFTTLDVYIREGGNPKRRRADVHVNKAETGVERTRSRREQTRDRSPDHWSGRQRGLGGRGWGGTGGSLGSGGHALYLDCGCWELNCAPQICYVESPTPNVVVLGGGAFGRYLGLNEVRRVGPWSCAIGDLLGRDTLSPCLSPSLPLCLPPLFPATLWVHRGSHL